MNTDIEQIEQRAGGVTPAYSLLGVSRPGWYRYRSGAQPIPPYIAASIRAHLLLSEQQFSRLVRALDPSAVREGGVGPEGPSG